MCVCHLGTDCEPQCLYNVYRDEDERRELSQGGRGGDEDKQALQRLRRIYDNIGTEPANPIDQMWNEQGTPYDVGACKAATAGGGYWRPWLG